MNPEYLGNHEKANQGETACIKIICEATKFNEILPISYLKLLYGEVMENVLAEIWLYKTI